MQQSLLKLLEGREVFVPLNVTQHWNKHDFVQVDTRDILFICAGTFSRPHDYGERRSALGFGFGAGGERARAAQRIGTQGAGRLRHAAGVPRPAAGDGAARRARPRTSCCRVLTVPPDAIVREYQELLALDGIDLDFTTRRCARWSASPSSGSGRARPARLIEEVCQT